jgi:hypothetical protein
MRDIIKWLRWRRLVRQSKAHYTAWHVSKVAPVFKEISAHRWWLDSIEVTTGAAYLAELTSREGFLKALALKRGEVDPSFEDLKSILREVSQLCVIRLADAAPIGVVDALGSGKTYELFVDVGRRRLESV